MNESRLIGMLSEAKKEHKDACERGNGLVAEYYEGKIDTINDILDCCLQCKKDMVNEMYTRIIKDVSEREFDRYIKLFVLDAISESHEKILKDILK